MRSRHEMTEEEECLNGLREVKSECERAPACSLKRRHPGKKGPYSPDFLQMLTSDVSSSRLEQVSERNRHRKER